MNDDLCVFVCVRVRCLPHKKFVFFVLKTGVFLVQARAYAYVPTKADTDAPTRHECTRGRDKQRRRKPVSSRHHCLD